ncbi:uncharacterized protein [Dysidea avara]|uniref:uncharacterized protein isoform X1 n=1 Tax=Dysidea avara TaxID=196820 RepID=UPI003328608F
MTEFEEKALLLSDYDSLQVCAGGAEKTPGSVKAKPNHQTVIDTASNITTVPPPHTINQFYPPSGQYQRTAVVTQPVASYATQQNNTYKLNDYKVKIYLLVACSCLACCIFWPTAMAACCLTGSAYVAANDGKDPRFYMILAIIMIVLSVIVGIPFSVWYITTQQNEFNSTTSHL